MKKYFFKPILLLGILGISGLVISCNDDEGPALPTISISDTEVTAAPGEVVSVDITATTAAGFGSLVVTKLWDGAAQNEETFDVLPSSYAYTVTEEDADHIVTINFTVIDKASKTDATELVIAIQLTPRQLLLKYNWRLSEEFRKKTSANDIAEEYTDDVLRFNEDGTYEKSIGEMHDTFNDLIYNYCAYNLNDNTLRVLLSKSENFFMSDAVDTLDITIIDDTKLYADVTYYDLNLLDTEETPIPHDPVEYYEKRFVAVPKVSTFDPYNPGADDDAGPGECREQVLVND